MTRYLTILCLLTAPAYAQDWLDKPQSIPEQWQQPSTIEPAEPQSQYLLDDQGRLNYQPFNQSRDWTSFVEPMTPAPVPQSHENRYLNGQ